MNRTTVAERKQGAGLLVVGVLLLASAAAGLVIPRLFDMAPKTQNFYGLLLFAALYGLGLLVRPGATLWIGMLAAVVFLSVTGFQYDVRVHSYLMVSALDCLLLSLVAVLVLRKAQAPAWGSHLPAIRRALKLFVAFLPIGVAISLWRGVDPIEIAALTKSFYFPLLFLYAVPRIITTRRRLAIIIVLALTLALVAGARSRIEGPPLDQRLANPHMSTSAYERSYGSWATPNPFANYLLFAALVPMAFALRLSRPVQAVAAGTAAAVAGWAILGTFTRGAWLAGLCGAVFLAVSDRIQKLVIIVVCVAVLVSILPDAVHNRATSYTDSSAQNRLRLWRTGWAVTQKYPVLGAGWGSNFMLVDQVPIPIGGPPWWHNDYLIVSSQVGLTGLAVYLSLWVAIIRAGVRSARATSDAFYRPLIFGLTASLVATLTAAFFEHVLWRFDAGPHNWFLVSCLITAIVLSRSQAKESLGVRDA